MRRSTLLCAGFSAVLIGLIVGRYNNIDAAAIAVIGLGLAALRRPRLIAAGVIMLGLALGLWRAEAARSDTQILTSQIGTTIVVSGSVSDDPGVTSTGGAAFKLGNLVVNGRPVSGVVPVYMQRINLHRGYQVTATGKLKTGFGNSPVELSYPQVTVTSTHQSLLERTRQRFFAGIKTALPEPTASFGLGLLVGIRALIPKDLQTQLALVGLSHLVAVSGYNLTIIVQATERALGRFGRNITLAGSLWLIGLFVVAAGGGASIIRAALVSILSLSAGYFGRQFRPLVLILLAAAATAAYHPGYLTDYGWLLSFTAFFGIMVLAPAITAKLTRPPGFVTKMLVETVCAQLLTLPLIAYAFGQLSLISPLSNLVELPLVPLAMLTSLIAGLGGMFIPAFAGWVAWPAYLLLKFMLWLVAVMAGVSWAGSTVTLGFVGMLVIYACIALATAALCRAPRAKSEQLLPISASSTIISY